MQRLKALVISLALLAFSQGLAFASSAQLSIRNAFKGPDGQLLIEVAGEGFASGNRWFWGNSSVAFQLELGWDEQSSTGRTVGFYADKPELARAHPESQGDFFIEGDRAEVQCGGEPLLVMTGLNQAELTGLQSRLDQKILRLKHLPEAMEPSFLFQSQLNGELIYVQAPVFNFHGNYEVYMGRSEKMRKMELVVVGNANKSPVMIQFKSGGGIHVPGVIELFQRGTGDRGHPAIIRSAAGPVENLLRPKLSRAEIAALAARFGAKIGQRFQLETPCTAAALR